MKVLAVVLLGIGLVHGAEVHQLDSDGANPAASDVSAADMDAGRSEGVRKLSMPGPAYGNPGYKESHNWESDVDVFSPVVFSQKYYAAKYDLADQTAGEIKTNWKTVALADDLVAPNCRQASADFSLNDYSEQNPEVAEATGGNCAKLMQSYLSSGIYEGKIGSTACKVLRDGQSSFTVEKTELDTSTTGDPTTFHLGAQEYTLSFWVKLEDTLGIDGNIFHYGNTEYARSPAVYAKAGTTNLKFSISQTNEQDFGCDLDGDGTHEDGFLEKKTWYQIVMVVKSNGAAVYVDGVKKTECDNADGTTVVQPSGTIMYVSDPWSEPARASIQKMVYYPNVMMADTEITAQYEIEKPLVADA
jgi:hypothetical protein